MEERIHMIIDITVNLVTAPFARLAGLQLTKAVKSTEFDIIDKQRNSTATTGGRL